LITDSYAASAVGGVCPSGYAKSNSLCVNTVNKTYIMNPYTPIIATSATNNNTNTINVTNNTNTTTNSSSALNTTNTTTNNTTQNAFISPSSIDGFCSNSTS
jgi:hypothetical protein